MNNGGRQQLFIVLKAHRLLHFLENKWIKFVADDKRIIGPIVLVFLQYRMFRPLSVMKNFTASALIRPFLFQLHRKEEGFYYLLNPHLSRMLHGKMEFTMHVLRAFKKKLPKHRAYKLRLTSAKYWCQQKIYVLSYSKCTHNFIYPGNFNHVE